MLTLYGEDGGTIPSSPKSLIIYLGLLHSVTKFGTSFHKDNLLKRRLKILSLLTDAGEWHQLAVLGQGVVSFPTGSGFLLRPPKTLSMGVRGKRQNRQPKRFTVSAKGGDGDKASRTAWCHGDIGLHRQLCVLVVYVTPKLCFKNYALWLVEAVV